MATTALLPEVGERLVLPGGAGLTSKPHRDRTTTSRLTWTVSPAPGIGLPGPPPPCGGGLTGATTDPDGCHIMTVVLPGADVRTGSGLKSAGEDRRASPPRQQVPASVQQTSFRRVDRFRPPVRPGG